MMKNGWKTSSKQPVKNKKTIKAIVDIKNILSRMHPVSFQHIQIHQPPSTGTPWNGPCDMATTQINQLLLSV